MLIKVVNRSKITAALSLKKNAGMESNKIQVKCNIKQKTFNYKLLFFKNPNNTIILLVKNNETT